MVIEDGIQRFRFLFRNIAAVQNPANKLAKIVQKFAIFLYKHRFKYVILLTW